MPVYSYRCNACEHPFDEFHTSFRAADIAEKTGIPCPKCKRDDEVTRDEVASMKGGAFRKYGLWTYDGAGNSVF